jgi:hypothetical protein
MSNQNLGPRYRQPRQPTGIQYKFNISDTQLSFDSEAFTNLLRSQGVKVVHFRAIPDPTGMATRGDDHAVSAPRQSSDGFLYVEAGEFQGSFLQNSNESTIDLLGDVQSSTAVMTIPDRYEGKGDSLLVSQYDRFYIKDIELRVVGKQYIEAGVTGVDRLQYPATAVEAIVDASGIYYREDTDYKINKDGNIEWTGQHRPGFNPTIGRGVIYAIRYRYTPFYIVGRLLHEVRVSQITDPATFERKVTRMPYQVVLYRENIFMDMNKSSESHNDDTRFQGAPPSGGMLGPTG